MIDSYQKAMFDRRAAIVVGTMGVLTSVLVLQMMNLQIFNRDRYRRLSQNNIYRIRVEIPRRGMILGEGGVELARDEQVYRLYVIPRETKDFDSVISFLADNLGLNERNLARIARVRRRQRNFQPILIREKLGWQKMAELSAMNIPGMHIEQGYARRYPFGGMAAHAIGYLSEPKDSVIPFFKVGRAGLERMYNEDLMGKTGQRVMISNAEGRIIGESEEQAIMAIPGIPLQTTLIKSVQERMEKELERLESGCGVVMNAETGDIYAMTSLPSFNADLFGGEDGEEYMDELTRNPKKPFMNKVLDGLYPPGSVFKIVVALAGLETGVVKPTDTVRCTGAWRLGNHLYHCWERRGHGVVDMHLAMKHSCDIWFYQMSLKIGIDAISAMARRLGLGAEVFANYDESERPGIIPSREWKESNVGTQWVHGDTVITAIGQGFVLANCMQLAVMLGAAVTNYRVKPRLTFDKEIARESIGLNPAHMADVMKSLAAVLEPRGTASGSAVNVRGHRMGGKTGTSQVRRISLEERATGIRRTEDLPWELRNHGLFVGYAPLDNPKYVIAMVGEHVGSSSPVARAVAAVMRELLNVKP